MRRLASSLMCTLASFALLAACSSGGTPTLTSGLPQPAAEQGGDQPPPPSTGLSALPSLPSISSLTKAADLPVGTPTEVYTRVARGALTCWFGASGPLKGPYIYHADADPPSKGGKAEIDVRTRDFTAADPRSLKAFHVGIEAGGEGTRVDIENVKIPEPLATRLTADVHRWAANQEGCSEEPITAGWAARPAAPAKTSKDSSKKASTKAPAAAVKK